MLSGECLLLVEGEERRLRPWDLFHCPPWTEHAIVGAGDGPCVVLMAGARSSPDVRYPVSELAARYGALRRERGGRDLRVEAGVRDGRAVPARAATEVGSSSLGLDPFKRHSRALARAGVRLFGGEVADSVSVRVRSTLPTTP